MLTSLTLSRGYLAHFRNIWNSAFETCRCPDLWTDETGCRRMPAQPTQPPKLCPPDKPCPPTSRLGHQIQPTIAHHNQIQPTAITFNPPAPTWGLQRETSTGQILHTMISGFEPPEDVLRRVLFKCILNNVIYRCIQMLENRPNLKCLRQQFLFLKYATRRMNNSCLRTRTFSSF